jgi:hypothetical protein
MTITMPVYASESDVTNNLIECLEAITPLYEPNRQPESEEFRDHPKLNCMIDGAPLCVRIADGIIELENILNLWPEGYILEDIVTEEDVAAVYRALLHVFSRLCTEPMSPAYLKICSI